jgi:hypothetical protein
MSSELEYWNGEAVFERWAPEDCVWSPWVKPLLFAEQPTRALPPVDAALERIDVSWAPETTVESIAMDDGNYRETPERTRVPAQGRAALVVDLAGYDSALMGLALIARGYRPVPLFNGSGGGISGARVEAIGAALVAGARLLAPGALPGDAPPAFLLDSDRFGPAPSPGSFDGRWVVFPQDFPSATMLRRYGLERVLWAGASDKVAEDLSHVLLAYQRQGVATWSARTSDPPKKLEISEPSQFRSLARRAAVILGLRRNAAGGFGAMVPVPQESSGGYG